MVMEWKREGNVIAQRFKAEEVPGFLTKEFEAKDNEFVVVERGGEIYRERGPGRFSMGAMAGDFTSMLLIDKSEKVIEKDLKNVWLEEGNKIEIGFVIRFKVFHSDRFSKNLMGENRTFLVEDAWNHILSEIIYERILPGIKRRSSRDIIREDFRESVKSRFESVMKMKFSEWGLMLSSFSVDFRVTGSHAPSEEPGPAEEAELPKDIHKPPVIETEYKPGLEKTHEKPAQPADREQLEELLENLKKSRKVAEKKFYAKELPEEAFRVMVGDFDRKIGEIEKRLRSST